MKYFLFIFCFFSSLAFSSEAADVSKFDEWLNALRAEAIEKGISKSVVESSLADVSYIERAVQADRAQPEFKESYQDYIHKRVSEWRIDKGQRYLQEHGAAMQEVSERYGVPARFIAAIIGVETNYGAFDLKHQAFDVLATLAFDARRGQRFRREIFAALVMLDKGYANKDFFKSSWAGALGIPQFMPSTYLDFAVDFDGDGQRNIWAHGPDLWASVANYLSRYGWDSSEAWARKVVVPSDKLQQYEGTQTNIADIPQRCVRYKKHLTGWRVLADWNEEGVRRMNGRDLPAVDLAASIIVTEPKYNHAYLVYGNFCSLMRYNPSFKYALSVGALADAIKP